MICMKSSLERGLPLAIATVLLCGSVGADATLRSSSWVLAPEAVQVPYPDGVPHTDPQGRLRMAFDQETSFFPIGLYHGVTGTYGGITYSFEPIATAGFNTVVAWGGVPTKLVLEAADRYGLQAVISLPRDEEVQIALDHKYVLGFDIDHEPSAAEPESEVLVRLVKFRENRDKIRAIDPDRSVFTVDAPVVSDARLGAWETWRRAGDVTSFWNYPIAGGHSVSIGGELGVGEIISRAVVAVDGRIPVWFVAQAFEGPVYDFDWRMPSPDQVRAIAYAAMIHGATGLIWFSYDSFVTRDGYVIGISPLPRKNYDFVLRNKTPPYKPLLADVSQMDASRKLWYAIAALNAELSEHRELWLSPTAKIDYQVEIRGARTSRTPIRTQLKKTSDGLFLVAVNVDEDPVDFRIGFKTPIESIKFIVGETTLATDDGKIVGTLAGFGAFVLRLM
jgi:hypothetical protein